MPSDQRILLKETRYTGWIYPELLKESQCQQYRKVIDQLASERGKSNTRYFQNIIKLPDVAQEIWKIIQKDLPSKLTRDDQTYELVGLSDHITTSRHQGKNIGIHKDEDVRIAIKGDRYDNLYCFYKLAIYLNDCSDPKNPKDLSGGTSFYDKKKRLIYTTKPVTGTGVLFDMREWHSGAFVPEDKTKYMMGLRPVYKKIKTRCPDCGRYH